MSAARRCLVPESRWPLAGRQSGSGGGGGGGSGSVGGCRVGASPSKRALVDCQAACGRILIGAKPWGKTNGPAASQARVRRDHFTGAWHKIKPAPAGQWLASGVCVFDWGHDRSWPKRIVCLFEFPLLSLLALRRIRPLAQSMPGRQMTTGEASSGAPLAGFCPIVRAKRSRPASTFGNCFGFCPSGWLGAWGPAKSAEHAGCLRWLMRRLCPCLSVPSGGRPVSPTLRVHHLERLGSTRLERRRPPRARFQMISDI